MPKYTEMSSSRNAGVAGAWEPGANWPPTFYLKGQNMPVPHQSWLSLSIDINIWYPKIYVDRLRRFLISLLPPSWLSLRLLIGLICRVLASEGGGCTCSWACMPYRGWHIQIYTPHIIYSPDGCVYPGIIAYAVRASQGFLGACFG